MKIKLTYFKQSGKYYTEGEIDYKPETIDIFWESINYIKKLQELGDLPGLMKGSREFIIYVLPMIYEDSTLAHIILPYKYKLLSTLDLGMLTSTRQ